MTVRLQKGANSLLMYKNQNLDEITVGLGWSKNNDFDVDISAFMLNEDGYVRNDKDFIFYNQPEGPNCCIVLYEDANSDDDMCCFTLNLSKIPKDINKIQFVATIVSEENRDINFSMIENAYIRIMQKDNDYEIIRFDIEEINNEVALIIGEIYQYQEKWKFRAVGQGYNGGLEVITSAYGVKVESDQNKISNDSEFKTTQSPNLSRKTKRSPKKKLEQHTEQIIEQIKQFIPQINTAVEKKQNESNTRMVLDKILMEVLDYRIEEVKAEQKIQGRKADYVLSLNDTDIMVVEAKKAGMSLREKHIFQATSYGAYSGIKWALLTNLVTWQLYRISTQEKVEANLLFSIDLLPELSRDDAKKFVLISRYGMTRKGLLENTWNEIKARSHESITRAILTEDVINKIRLVIKKDTGCNLSNEAIQEVVEEILQ
ncbi:Stress protein [Desulfamplus magnetovallimortis]|uniref:Stress protein n=1 Tax=Desulfamplus magnetovallimortis TaxID=1246637 RepID=A0A1W1H6N1_9BACT|nr:TerD family protein [Desulfamplus magnetovallimortis]SLM28117.1 Stress protein [Desulfamplus magnetovallimortis]